MSESNNKTPEPAAFSVDWHCAGYRCTCGARVGFGDYTNADDKATYQPHGVTFPTCKACGRKGVIVMSPHLSSLFHAAALTMILRSPHERNDGATGQPGDALHASETLRCIRDRVMDLNAIDSVTPPTAFDPAVIYANAAEAIRARVVQSLQLAATNRDLLMAEITAAMQRELAKLTGAGDVARLPDAHDRPPAIQS